MSFDPTPRAIPLITEETVAGRLSWAGVVEALRRGHAAAKAEIGDQFLHRGPDTLLSRAAWIDGLGVGVKSVTVMAGNAARGAPTVQGAMLVFEDETGRPEAVIDSDLVTRWKTAGDSVLGAAILARPESRRLLILGAGVVAESLVEAYSALFPALESIEIWNRSPDRAEALVARLAGAGFPVRRAADLEMASGAADIVATATMAREPVLRGAWIAPGTHVDLIGAFKPDMREADDALLARAELFVDSRETTLGHIGELMIPIASGAITPAHLRGDLYDLCAGRAGRSGPEAVTVFKNGGGAHLDLMTAKAILAAADLGAAVS